MGPTGTPAAAPNGIDQGALLSGAITAPRTIALDAPVTLGSLTIDSPQKYLVGGPNALTMQVARRIATIDVATGSHEIAAPLILASDTDITVTNAADTLTLSGGVGGSGMLSKEGSGTLTISGANSYTGNTAVDGGKLRFQIATGSAIGGQRRDRDGCCRRHTRTGRHRLGPGDGGRQSRADHQRQHRLRADRDWQKPSRRPY